LVRITPLANNRSSGHPGIQDTKIRALRPGRCLTRAKRNRLSARQGYRLVRRLRRGRRINRILGSVIDAQITAKALKTHRPRQRNSNGNNGIDPAEAASGCTLPSQRAHVDLRDRFDRTSRGLDVPRSCATLDADDDVVIRPCFKPMLDAKTMDTEAPLRHFGAIRPLSGT